MYSSFNPESLDTSFISSLSYNLIPNFSASNFPMYLPPEPYSLAIVIIMFLLLFVFLILFIGVFTYDGVLSLIPIVISVFYTLSSFNSNAKWNRFCVLFLAFVWIYYNFKVEAYISILGNLMEIVSGILALVRFKE